MSKEEPNSHLKLAFKILHFFKLFKLFSKSLKSSSKVLADQFE